MKTIKKTPVILFILLVTLGASATGTREQLKKVNSYWAYHPLADKILDKDLVFASDRELIQLHLQLVEKTLRANHSRALSEEQEKNRLKLLDVLHNYRVAGQFPQNTGHTIRTPYFIDKYNTACAVGQLIISSGNLNLARQISRENNNGYIVELVQKYPLIKDWAKQNGFTIEELAWIQPCYQAPPDTIGFSNPSCHSAVNGYYRPDFGQLQGAYTKAFYRWDGTNWVPWTNMCGQWMYYYLSAGKYKWEVIDLNTTYTFSTQLVAPPAATVTVLESGNFSTCNGIITVSAQAGQQPFGYYWAGRTETTSVLSSVCVESVSLTFYERSYMCPQVIQLQTSPVGVQELIADDFDMSPNPVADMLYLKFDAALRSKYKVVTVLNSQGQLVLRTDLENESVNLNLASLSPGLYFLQVDNNKGRRFVKQ